MKWLFEDDTLKHDLCRISQDKLVQTHVRFLMAMDITMTC